jgi:rare lipoprotein A
LKAEGGRRKAEGKSHPPRGGRYLRLTPYALRLVAAALLATSLAGCGGAPTREPAAKTPTPPRTGGGYYLDDGPGANPPADIDSIPDAVPRAEPIRNATSRPYVVMGRSYTPMTSLQPYRARGIATWYGRRYHGKPTSSGEIYDMYAMTAAHTTLPIPSYARVTNISNGRSVVVRINDRGPFVEGRIIDLSYTAAHRIGVLGGGSAMVEVETLIPDASGTVTAVAPRAPVQPAAKPEAAPPPVPHEPEPAAAASPVVATAPQVPVAAESGGYFLQLGAFGSKDNAENFLARMKAQVDWLSPTLHIHQRDGLFRVHAGPYANQADARATAERVTQSLGVKPVVLTR